MAEKSVVMVTGVSDYWGAKIASRLLQFEQLQVIGVDEVEPAQYEESLQFFQIDLSSQSIGDLLVEEQVDTVCHLKYIEQDSRPASTANINIEYAKNLLSACANNGVNSVIIRSSTTVYGARRDNPAFLTEEAPVREGRFSWFAQDHIEIERECQSFREHFPQKDLTVLRFANIIGRSADSPLTRLLRQRRPGILMGFDPIFQLIHQEDVVEALAQAVTSKWTGTTNVAAEGSMPLSRLLRLVGKTPLPVFHPLVYARKGPFRSSKYGASKRQPIGWDYLRYSWVADTTKMRDELSFYPSYTAEEAAREFSGKESSNSENGE
jgi:UDP-glucose 4-epimerase